MKNNGVGIDPEFLEHYLGELQYITEAYRIFCREHPKVAARFGSQAGEVGDPWVERLLQGFAWSAAHMQMDIARTGIEVPLNKLEGADQNLVAPQPSVGVVQFYADARATHSPKGLTLPRGTHLTMPAPRDATACGFLTSQPVTVWPLAISRVRFTGIPPDIPSLYHFLHDQDTSRVRGALRLRLTTFNGLPLCRLDGLDRLPVYLCGEERLASQLFELIHTSVVGMAMGVPGQFETGSLYGQREPGLPFMRVEHEGLEPDESLLRPVWPKFHGQRLVHDFFTLPARFGFFTLTGLAAGLKQIDGPEVEIVLLLSREVAMLDPRIDASHLALYCSPAANLFPAPGDRQEIDPEQDEHWLVPVADRPDDYEVHSVDLALGQVDEESEKFAFRPLHAGLPEVTRRNGRHFTLRRAQVQVMDSERQYETHHEFVRTPAWLTLLGMDRQPDKTGIRYLTLDAWLTNGDLPCVKAANGRNDLTVADAKSVASVGFVRGPTAPRAPLVSGHCGRAAWELVRQLHLELAVFDNQFNEPSPGEGLRLMLRPWLAAGEPGMARFLDALVGAKAEVVHAMHRWADDMELSRGIGITLTFDESRLDGFSPFGFALALERYVARHVSQHSFTRTILRTVQRGHVFTWPTRSGTREAF